MEWMVSRRVVPANTSSIDMFDESSVRIEVFTPDSLHKPSGAFITFFLDSQSEMMLWHNSDATVPLANRK